MRMSYRRSLLRLSLAGWVALVGSGIVGAQESPDSQVNPVTGYIESVYVSWSGSDWDVVHVVDPGAGSQQAETVIAGAVGDELGPRLTIDPVGEVGVTWWEPGGVEEVYFKSRDPVTGVWSPAERVSATGQSSRHPAVVHDGSGFWVTFEYDAGGGETGVAVQGISDNPEPYPISLGTTTFGGSVDPQIHTGSGQAWATWVDSTSDVAWSAYDPETDAWSLPGYESYGGDTVEDARARIRTEITGS